MLPVIAVCGCVGAGCNRQDAPAPAAPETDEITDLKLTPAPPSLAAIALRPALREREPSACPQGMVLVEGMYCPEVRQHCTRYLDPRGRYEYFRCAEYAKPAECVSKQRKKLRFCMDRDEYAEEPGGLPANHQSFSRASQVCGRLGKRVCLESEYNFACEGEEMRPYPYGFKRDASAVNADRTDILDDSGRLKDLRAPAGAHPRCISPFGVRDLSGNLEEFVAIDGTRPALPAMKGAYWQPSRNFCRANQTAHDRYYQGTETGFRCCADSAGD